jgi:ATP adenylyltransferase
MEKLYCPWRSEYVEKEAHTKNENSSKDVCVFCSQFQESDDRKNLILKRFDSIAIIMNKYPYNAGHLLVLPLEHKSRLSEYSKEIRSELMEAVNLAIETIGKALKKPEGFNVGINLGKASGAGIPAHLHIHVLPRWVGDTNFLPLLGDTKQISFDLFKMYDELKKEFDKLEI